MNFKGCGRKRWLRKNHYSRTFVSGRMQTELPGQKLRQDKSFPAHAMKVYGECRCATPLIITLGTKWRWVHLLLHSAPNEDECTYYYPRHQMKMSALIITLGTKWRWVHLLLTSAPNGDEWSASRPGRITLRKEPRHPVNRRLGGNQSRCGRFEDERNFLPQPGFKPRTVQLVARSVTPSTPSLIRYNWPYSNLHPLNTSPNALDLTG